jgi:hypothetical protein
MTDTVRRPVDPWNESTITAAEESRVRDQAQLLELRGQGWTGSCSGPETRVSCRSPIRPLTSSWRSPRYPTRPMRNEQSQNWSA